MPEALDLFPQGGAVLCPSGLYRYRLWRILDVTNPRRVVFGLANPSTADAHEDDPTVRKVVGFARRWGFGRVDVVNGRAWRATDPRDVPEGAVAEGPENRRHIAEACEGAALFVAAWGGVKGAHEPGLAMARIALASLPSGFRRVQCLSRTADGRPRHPLMLAYSTPLEDYTSALYG